MQRFSEMDIDNILQSSAVVIHDGDKMKTAKSGASSFNKASFVVSSECGADEVDVTDPDFWKKVVGVVQDEVSENDWDRSGRRRKAAGVSYREPSFRAMGNLDADLAQFISAGRLSCSIDKVNGIVSSTRPDTKNAQYQATIKQGDLLLNRVQKLSKVIEL